jgi:hypothetical protein
MPIQLLPTIGKDVVGVDNPLAAASKRLKKRGILYISHKNSLVSVGPLQSPY